jgi:hypothetical protein
MNEEVNNRSLNGALRELKQELSASLETRYEMLKSEVNQKLASIKTATPMLIVATIFLLVAFFLFTLCLVGLVSVAFYDNPYKWFLSFVIVAVLWSLIGGLAALFGIRQLRAQALMPRRTLKVLKEDQIWLQNEARTPS